jgi:hypothetical protein
MPANTPIYNFPYPVGTDFVKDGAVAIEDLALAVETVIDSLPSGALITRNAQTGTAYTLAASDGGKLVTLTNAAAITLTVPVNSSVAIPVDTRIDLLAGGAGTVTVSPAGGVTVNSKDGNLALTGQWSAATLIKTATNTWVLIGDLA